MEHGSTVAEIARILRPAGIFAAYDYDRPPLIDWEVDAAFLAVIEASGVDPDRPERLDISSGCEQADASAGSGSSVCTCANSVAESASRCSLWPSDRSREG